MDRRLLDYLPPVLREVLEFRAVNAANEPELKTAWDALEQVLSDQFLDSASAAGVARWEKELELRPKATDTLPLRKARVKALWNAKPPYTLPWLRGWLDGLFGTSNHTELVEDYTLTIELDHTDLPGAKALAEEMICQLADLRPCNLRLLLAALLQSHAAVCCGVLTEAAVQLELWPEGSALRMESTGTLRPVLTAECHTTLEVHMKKREE